MLMLIPPPLSLYVHLPWCVRKCPYCDFNSHQAKGALPFDAYVNALLRDLEYDLPLVWGRVVHSVFLGGGTPSLFPPEAIDRFLQIAAARLRLAPDAEITLETNPGTAEYGRFDRYLAAGINRLSFGIQSFNDAALRRLGRIHDSLQAEHAVKLAQDAGFTNINLDLMYALPEQTLLEAEHDLQRAFALAPTHLSYYQLTLEPNTVFYARPPQGIPDDDAAWEMQEHTQRLLAEAGYQHYEVSAYAREGWQCLHNLNYWRFGDYLGIGAGAHGKITSGVSQHVLRRWKCKHPYTYLDNAGTVSAIGGDEIVPTARLPFEYMLNLLRLREGFRLQDFALRTGLTVESIHAALREAVARGWLRCELEHVIPTELGLRFANDVINLFNE
ncbi:radical SAM family heme chaperone HemW [Xylella fastidiosa]|uniref:Heme chaperone HemW n=2 Tax=Xylella fastidiosa TaxID=2371 RepID=A0A9Q4MI15_XYLFS|nr:radical SAM family heme chaperone HemW [Xylella fastidiosa]KAJ4854041.1 radical SAM family heme chaperone HemW [Xylella fastidiosa subsp. multiplex]MBS9446043.1 radical SAM family heme chaperone HemW [Xylella fastidiosa subsp. multiplex]MBS9448077.1 radical SAM family heme chaperone HemW [Xylella fastidiosa subsp. multiplex]MBS9450099.1 radical SAM family heme chaperone HemW [Xylella fastidiosa subsp. multiplex]MBS9452053.1 radical SAM family heme chaperone HemW [Xylella fastidiosa subsp. m